MVYISGIILEVHALDELEMVFMKHCVPNHLFVVKDGTLFLDKVHKFEVSTTGYTTTHPLSADHLKLLAVK